MAESKTYVAHKLNFTIHRGDEYVQRKEGDDLVTVKESKEPIEFSNGEFTTDDPELQEAIESHAGFAETLANGEVALKPDPDELEQAAEEAPSSTSLEEKLETAETEEEVAEILAEHDLPAPDTNGSSEKESGESADEETEKTEVEEYDGELQVIEGVSNKDEALSALESIQGVTFDVSAADKVGKISAAAEEKGYTFKGWPA